MKSRSSLSHLLSILREACMQTTFFDPVDLNAIKRQSPPPHPPTAAGVPAAADTLADWLASPVSAYAAWIDPWPLKDSTKAVYRAMFGRFCQWLAVRGKRLDQLDSAREIGLFLDTPNPNLPSSRKHRSSSGRQRPQYVRLLERVFAHLESLGHRGGNPGQRAGLERIGQGADQPTRFLSWDERVAVARVLEEGLEELRQAQKGVEAWIAYRDLALVGAMAGGGLKVGHLQRLSLNCISLAERQFDLGTARRPHRARLLAFAVEPVAAWLSVRGVVVRSRRAVRWASRSDATRLRGARRGWSGSAQALRSDDHAPHSGGPSARRYYRRAGRSADLA